MKNHVLVRKRWNVCRRVVTAKRITKITAAAMEGLYVYAIQLLFEETIFMWMLVVFALDVGCVSVRSILESSK